MISNRSSINDNNITISSISNRMNNIIISSSMISIINISSMNNMKY